MAAQPRLDGSLYKATGVPRSETEAVGDPILQRQQQKGNEMFTNWKTEEGEFY